jgi:hypothetical protein
MPDAERFFAEVAEASKPGALLLVAEPAGHVNKATFEAELAAAVKGGFEVKERPRIRRSLTALPRKVATGELTGPNRESNMIHGLDESTSGLSCEGFLSGSAAGFLSSTRREKRCRPLAV